ncbi:glycosyltransferase family protein [Allokutzneria albata]|uniref:hypothetical protein n=1 Tax=Allokutzneria albata TaxID=211114 RepID=UPI001E536FC3|nr:hypothetical protein [Allokutzneria albata]
MAELVGAAYVHVCPVTLPSSHHLPAAWAGWPQDGTGGWDAEARQWNDTWAAPSTPTGRLSDSPRSMTSSAMCSPTSPGPLPAEVEAFLAESDSPVCFGMGSYSADVSRVMVAAARVLGRRAIVSRGWAGLSSAEDDTDCIEVGELNHRALFARVAASCTTVARAQPRPPCTPELLRS